MTVQVDFLGFVEELISRMAIPSRYGSLIAALGDVVADADWLPPDLLSSRRRGDRDRLETTERQIEAVAPDSIRLVFSGAARPDTPAFVVGDPEGGQFWGIVVSPGPARTTPTFVLIRPDLDRWTGDKWAGEELPGAITDGLRSLFANSESAAEDAAADGDDAEEGG